MTEQTAMRQAREAGADILDGADKFARWLARIGSAAAAHIPVPEIKRIATEADFAVASRIDRARAVLLTHERVRALAERLQTQVSALDSLGAELPDAADEIAAQKGHIAWLLAELRRAE